MKRPTNQQIRVGDVVTLCAGITDQTRGGTVVAVFGEQVVYRCADGSYDSWHDPTELRVIARPASPPPTTTAGIAVGDVITDVSDGSDAGKGGIVVRVGSGGITARMPCGDETTYEAADCVVLARAAALDGTAGPISADDFADGRSVDRNGVRIGLGDRVFVDDPGFTAIVVAVARGKLLVVSEGFGEIVAGDVSYCDRDELTVMPGKLDDVKGYVVGLIDRLEA